MGRDERCFGVGSEDRAENLDHDAENEVLIDGVQLELGEVESNVLEVREVVQPLGIEVFRQVEEVAEVRGGCPLAPVLKENDGENGWKAFGFGIVFAKNFPDAHLIGEQAQGHPGIDGFLVFEEQVEEERFAVETGGENEIGVALAELLVEESFFGRLEGRPVDRGGQDRRQIGLKERGHALQGAEAGFDESVVRVVEGSLLVHGG